MLHWWDWSGLGAAAITERWMGEFREAAQVIPWEISTHPERGQLFWSCPDRRIWISCAPTRLDHPTSITAVGLCWGMASPVALNEFPVLINLFIKHNCPLHSASIRLPFPQCFLNNLCGSGRCWVNLRCTVTCAGKSCSPLRFSNKPLF